MTQSLYNFITGLEGLALSSDEKSFLIDSKPWGVILFGRNVESPDQVKKLVHAVRDVCGWHIPVLIDQEGGRVQRLKKPHWPVYPAGELYAKAEQRHEGYGREAAFLGAQLIAYDLVCLGVDIDCLPVLDLPQPHADEIIGDRALGQNAEQIITLGRAQCEGLLSLGVLPVIKHIPGHGRALCDSHIALPHVETSLDLLEQTDFVPFKALADMPLAMSAHIIFDALDRDHAVTVSAAALDYIRDHLCFTGALMSDDLSMEALEGSLKERAYHAQKAGCDLLLHCNGKMDEMCDVASESVKLEGVRKKRCDQALTLRKRHPQDFDRESVLERFRFVLNDTEGLYG